MILSLFWEITAIANSQGSLSGTLSREDELVFRLIMAQNVELVEHLLNKN